MPYAIHMTDVRFFYLERGDTLPRPAVPWYFLVLSGMRKNSERRGKSLVHLIPTVAPGEYTIIGARSAFE